jgi:hypothetical protein
MSLNRFGGLITGTFNPLTDQKTATVEYLVVAGGGAGGGGIGGGGGAGGLLQAVNFAVVTGSALTITIGAGGVRGATENDIGTSGSNSVFSSITSTGGAIASYSISPALPAGLTFNTSTGLISGTPTETRTVTTHTITATNASGSATTNYRLRVTGDIGDIGPGGGKIFYYLAAGFSCGQTRATTCKYLEVAPTNWNAGTDPTRTWAQATPVNLQSNISANNLSLSSAIGYGAQNTKAIIDQGNNDSASSAASLAVSYSPTISGANYSDWFLPSELELSEIYIRRVAIGMEFSGASYWSSTSNGNQNGRYLIVTHVSATPGSFAGDIKSAMFNVRPIRAF